MNLELEIGFSSRAETAGFAFRQWRRRVGQRLLRMTVAVAEAVAPERVKNRERLFAELSRDYAGLIAGICLSFAHSEEDFQDLRQDTFLNIWNGLAAFRRDSSLSTWIYRVTLNTCVSSQRKKTRREEVQMDELYATLYENSPAEEIERYKLMYRLIGMLSPLDKSIVLMWIDGKSYDEISSVTGLSRDSVASRLKRSKGKLANFYNKIKND